jgi:DNA-binding NarL/FixJ family response regulator
MRRALEEGGMTVCAEVRDARTAITAAMRERPDLCLLAELDEGRLFAIRELRRRVPQSAVVVTGDTTHVDEAFGALYAGAAGFLPDDMSVERLPRTLRGVLSGEAALPRRLVARLIEELCREQQRARLADALHAHDINLTRRQADVLELLADGMSTAEIGESLSITEATVRSHIAAALAKMHVSTRAAAVDLLKQSV